MFFLFAFQKTSCNGFFSLPPHTPLVFGEGGGCGRTYFRLLVYDASGENECAILSETVPSWVSDVVVKVAKCTIFILFYFYILFYGSTSTRLAFKSDFFLN